MISNHQIPLSPIQAESVNFTIKGISGIRAAFVERIDETHANPKRAWEEMGKPIYLDQGQVEKLVEASELIKEPVKCVTTEDGVVIDVVIQPHSVVAISLLLEGII